MRAIVLASTALVLCLSGCKIGAPDVTGGASLLSLAQSTAKVCRDPRGRFAKCQTCADGSRIWTGATCPVVTPPPPPEPEPTPDPAPVTGWQLSPTADGEVPIASNFDTAAYLLTKGVPPTNAPDVLGAFRFICNAGQLLRDDPIVYPGQPGKSHLHQFYGNLGANAGSTYTSLRTSGETTCMSPLNRSAYWQPAMLDGKGNVVRPDYVNIYYKRRPTADPACRQTATTTNGRCAPVPNGLKFIFGFDMVTDRPPTGAAVWQCVVNWTPTGSFKNIPEGLASCPDLATATVPIRLGVIIQAPSCWDGKNLDSPNHRDHVAYKQHGWGIPYGVCPDTHPVSIPTFTMGSYYSIKAGDDLSLFKLSSDDMRPELPRGSTFHADFWMAWDKSVRDMWDGNCIDKLLNGSDGDLCNGRIMKRHPGYSTLANPRLVPVPAG